MAKHNAGSDGVNAMSFKLVAAVFDMKVGNPLRKMVLIKIADQANDDGICWPSYESIARSCEISRRSVVTHIQWLEDNGFLWIERRYNADESKNFSNRYHLTLSKAKQFKKVKTNKSKGGANAALVQEAPSGANAALGDAGNALGGATDALSNGAGAAPEPISKPINESINESSKAKKKKVVVSKPDELSQQTWDDLLELRKAKRAPLTPTAWKMADNAIEAIQYKTGHSIDQIVTVWVARGWTTVKEEWYFNHIKNNQPQPTNYQGNNHAAHQPANSQHQPKQSSADIYAAKLAEQRRQRDEAANAAATGCDRANIYDMEETF